MGCNKKTNKIITYNKHLEDIVIMITALMLVLTLGGILAGGLLAGADPPIMSQSSVGSTGRDGLKAGASAVHLLTVKHQPHSKA